MKATVARLGGLLLVGLIVPAVQADGGTGFGYAPPPGYGYPPAPRVAPDTCGPGYYCTHPCGAVYGPNYCVRPPFEPFNGFLPNLCNRCPQSMGARPGLPPLPTFPVIPRPPLDSAVIPTHPYARGPRDYFMLEN
jgi:hypothetical protein